MWWKGPPFLLDPPEKWPVMPTSRNTADVDQEVSKTLPRIVNTFATFANSSTEADISRVIDITQFSAFIKLLRVTALVLKFVDYCRGQGDVSDQRLTATDIERAETMWIKSVQRSSFNSELQSFGGHSVATLLQKQLNLFLNEEGIICCQGHIDHSTVPESNKTPI